jgi:hypothetical protein
MRSCAALPGRATLEGRFEQFETHYPVVWASEQFCSLKRSRA